MVVYVASCCTLIVTPSKIAVYKLCTFSSMGIQTPLSCRVKEDLAAKGIVSDTV